MNKKPSTLRRMLSYMKPHKGTVAIVVTLLLMITAMQLLRPIVIGNAIDQYITGEAAQLLPAQERFSGVLKAAAVYLGILLLLFVTERLQYILMQRMGQDIIHGMRLELFAHMESLTMRFFDTTPVGKIVTRITNDVEAINELYSNILSRLVQNGSRIIGLAIVMLCLNPALAGLSFLLVPAVAGLCVACSVLSHRASAVTRTRLTQMNTFLSEHLSGMRLIRIFRREKQKLEEFRQTSQSLFRAGWKEMMVMAVFRPVISVLSVLAMVILLGGGSSGVLAGTVSLGTLYVFLQYIDSFFEPIQELSEQISTLQAAIASAEKLFTFLDTQPLITDPEQPAPKKQVQGRIEFDHVWFAYDGETWVLKDVSFVIEPGSSVAFVGATGAGKSSILNLIGRYYDVQKGAIRIDGVDIRQLDRQVLRSWIGQVQQDVFIFTGDVASNIRLMNEEITDEQVESAAKHVNADRFIRRLPARYHEAVSERGGTFSAGERQLLSFARTLAADPAILILDEATANIDTETEQLIQEAIGTLMQGRTTIMVAHRLSTIQHADKIMVMHHGRIRETGTHQELLAMDGIYRKLYTLQLESGDREPS